MGHEDTPHHHPHDDGPSGGRDPGVHADAPGGHGHGHTHGFVDPSIASTSRGLWALKWSFVGLLGDRALPGGRRGAVGERRAPCGHHPQLRRRGHGDPARHCVLAAPGGRRPAASRMAWGVSRTSQASRSSPRSWPAPWWRRTRPSADCCSPGRSRCSGAVIAASIIGFLGNEAVAVFRIRVGRQIGSAALVADGYHARVDGWTSLAVLVGALGVWAGYPLADPVVGLADLGRDRLARLSRRATPSWCACSMVSIPRSLEAVGHAAGHAPGGPRGHGRAGPLDWTSPACGAERQRVA